MSELYDKSLLKLELDQVLLLLADCAGSSAGKAACVALQPTSDLEDVQLLLDQTSAAYDLCTRKGNPAFSDVKDVAASLDRADRGGVLQPKELLAIAGLLRWSGTERLSLRTERNSHFETRQLVHDCHPCLH